MQETLAPNGHFLNMFFKTIPLVGAQFEREAKYAVWDVLMSPSMKSSAME